MPTFAQTKGHLLYISTHHEGVILMNTHTLTRLDLSNRRWVRVNSVGCCYRHDVRNSMATIPTLDRQFESCPSPFFTWLCSSPDYYLTSLWTRVGIEGGVTVRVRDSLKVEF